MSPKLYRFFWHGWTYENKLLFEAEEDRDNINNNINRQQSLAFVPLTTLMVFHFASSWWAIGHREKQI
jgi:hypothetical protein